MEVAPVALFVYNRLKHTRATINALKANVLAEQTDLFIFADGPKTADQLSNVEALRTYLHSITGFKTVTIVERDTNVGLSRNITAGVNEIVTKYGRVIVLEDDLVTSPYFLQFMNEGLTTYRDEEKVISIMGYVYPVKAVLPETFLMRGADCWGWGTWKRGWELFNYDGQALLNQLLESDQTAAFDFGNTHPFTDMLKAQIKGKIDSWAIRWYASAFLQNKYTLYPGRSLVLNIGDDGSGTHMLSDDILKTSLSDTPIKIEKQPVVQNDEAYKAFAGFYRAVNNPPLLYRIKRFVKRKYNTLIK